ncbi:hypothetical protein JB92DRAFT_2995765 [Gautieria morchelliformis]|nr:hypothetical protein JB92DRAFT_2995765 [Gautieria morchelliformis]
MSAKDSLVSLTIAPLIVGQRYSLLSSLCTLFYNHILTFDDEVNLIWNHQQSPVTILFLASRYITLLFVIFDILSVCPIWTVSRRV